MPITPLFNDDLFNFVRELDDILEAHLANFIHHHDSTDPLHPQTVLLRVLHHQFTAHVQQHLTDIHIYSTNQHLLLTQLANNPLPPNPNPNPTNHTNPNPNPTNHTNPNPNPNPNTNQRQAQQSSTVRDQNPRSRRQRWSYYAVRRGRTRGVFSTWDECRLQVEGISNEFKGFNTIPEAHAYLGLPPAPFGPLSPE